MEIGRIAAFGGRGRLVRRVGFADAVGDGGDFEDGIDGDADPAQFPRAIERGDELAERGIHLHPETMTTTPGGHESGGNGVSDVAARAERVLKAHDYAERRDWPGYFRAVAGKPPRDTLIEALRLFDLEPASSPRLGVDLGSGEGRDSAEMLRRGWRVVAIDSHPQSMELLRARKDLVNVDRLECRVERFDDAGVPVCDLVNASYALPFCSRERFESMWRGMITAIRPGGRFAGQLFGDRDDWVKRGDSVHHSREEINRLFEGFVFDRLVEEDRLGEDGASAAKRWHVFHIVARKR